MYVCTMYGWTVHALAYEPTPMWLRKKTKRKLAVRLVIEFHIRGILRRRRYTSARPRAVWEPLVHFCPLPPRSGVDPEEKTDVGGRVGGREDSDLGCATLSVVDGLSGC